MTKIPLRSRINRLSKWMTGCVILAILAFAPSSSARRGQDAPRLELGQTLERMISGREIHRYRVSLAPGLYLRVEIAQKGIDVDVTALDPEGRRVVRIDRPNGAYGKEAVSVIAEAAGDYLIEVRPAFKYAAPAGYVITAAELRKATFDDRRRVEAEYAVNIGEEVRRERTAVRFTQ